MNQALLSLLGMARRRVAWPPEAALCCKAFGIEKPGWF